MKKAVLFAAGLGTRLKPFTDHHPKALAEVNGKSLLERNILYLYQSGIREIIINVHHFADQIKAVIAAYQMPELSLLISDEVNGPFETGGGLVFAKDLIVGDAEPFVVMNVDILTNMELQGMMDYHQQIRPLATLAVTKRNSSRQFLFDDHMRLVGWRNNNTGEYRWSAGEREGTVAYAFSGIHVISPEIFQLMPLGGKFSITDTYIKLAATHTILGYDHSGDHVIDVGKPEALEKASLLFR